MKLEHIAIAVTNKSEIEDFYLKILKMEQIRYFELDRQLASGIFGFTQSVPVYLLRKGDLTLEVFVAEDIFKKGFHHICFSVENREALLNLAKHHNYSTLLIEKEHHNIMFIKDNSGNIFELKNQ
jgi:catechol 2,3-dioxygenase-like lactoylglutathione lyase family enzyme